MNSIQQQIIYFISRASSLEKLEAKEKRILEVYGQVDKEFREAIDKRKSEINDSTRKNIP